ncbi:hypothetical protein CEUSTIGMA_g1046.t1 [Chlamydomonas eustigma]|uniref:COP9 signalosome complex subunit 4 n=1 Tax=Chlamydomonas eustigma TaxID=1157962 RepID=A0A250WRX9_9CHLO|nr:hypothetical protein CEUSTIGMA_g1046.t1 [Chlamydomonas eustigma]|eukprot:GAX73595.1 hypothetical protein CEUSTIGMA_g1046.t1 [Chlamydomonas eustigma]
MSDILKSLASIASLSDQKSKIEQYRTLLQSILVISEPEVLNAFIDHMLTDEVPLVVSRQLMMHFAQDLSRLSAEVFKPVATHALDRLQPRVVSFEEPVTLIREGLADQLEKEEQWSKAAGILAGIDLDSGVRNVDTSYKLSKSIKIAMLYLEDEDPVNAEMYIKKAASLIGTCKAADLELQYKVCYARILDSKRRFLEAALRYYELSLLSSQKAEGLTVDPEELIQSLGLAVTCTVLAPAGAQRSRMLSTLYKDERSPQLPVYPLLEKVYLERILSRQEVEAFAKTLKSHQMALLPDGTTVLERAVMQHNILSASKLYNNISLQELGALLGVASERAESISCDMISDGRLQASVDQVENMIHFHQGEVLLQWDAQIQSLCHKVNEIVDEAANAGIKLSA